MTDRVVFTARARADAIKQFHFLADRSPAASARRYTGLENAMAKLEEDYVSRYRIAFGGIAPSVIIPPPPIWRKHGGNPMLTLTLSDEALALFRLHIERHGDVNVDDTTRPVYRELARAG